MSEKILGLPVDIYSNFGENCSNGGISEKYNTCILVDPNIEGFIDIDKTKLPVVRIKTEQPTGKPYTSAVPVVEADVLKKWMMFGGCFIWTSDSRFRKLYPQPIPLHDRTEN